MKKKNNNNKNNNNHSNEYFILCIFFEKNMKLIETDYMYISRRRKDIYMYQYIIIKKPKQIKEINVFNI